MTFVCLRSQGDISNTQLDCGHPRGREFVHCWYSLLNDIVTEDSCSVFTSSYLSCEECHLEGSIEVAEVRSSMEANIIEGNWSAVRIALS